MSISQNLSSIRPTLNLNFARSKNLDPRITFTRSSSATYIDKNGILKTVATNIPRFGYNGLTGESTGLLLEPSKTNLCNYTNYVKLWANKDGIPQMISENTDLAPDGTYTATRIILSPVNYFTGKLFTFSFTSTVKCLSIFAKNPLSGTNSLAIEGAGRILINFNGQSITSISVDNGSPSYTYDTLANGWYRFTIIEDGTSNNRFTMMGWFNGTGKPILLWGAMAEYSPRPTSHIPAPATFTSRASSATFYDSTGILRTAATNVARSDAYFPDSSGVFRSTGLLLENSGTNLLYYSQDFDVTSWWGSTGANVFKAPQTLAPDGTYTADFLVEDTSTGNHSLSTTNNVYTVVAEYYTHSVYVKAAGRTQIGIGYRDSGFTLFDLTTKQITIVQQIANGSIVANNIDTLPNGWFRLSSTILGSGVNYNRRAQIFLCSGGTASYAGDGVSGAYIWGYQVEQSSYATSYVPTPAGFSSRASTATYFDSTGSLRTAAINELRNNAHFPDNSGVYRNVGNLLEPAATNLTGSSVFSNGWSQLGSGRFTAAADPVGGMQATLVTPLYTTSYNGFQNNASIAGGTYIVSFYAKANGYNWVGLKAWAGNPWFYTAAGYNLSTLAPFTYIQGGQTDYIFTPFNIQNAGNGWYRVSFKVVASGGFSSQLQILVYSDLPSQHAINWTPNGTSGAFFWGVQIESSPIATSYIPVLPTFTSRASTATYFDSNGILRTAGVNVARSDAYLPNTSEVYRPVGLLLEGSSTNLARNSEDFTQWASNGNGIGVSANQSVALDRTTTADHLFQTAATGAGRWIGSVSRTVTGGTTYTISCWVRRVSGTDGQPSIQMGFINSGEYGTSITSQVTSSWKRFSVTVTPVATVNTWIGFSIGWSDSGVANNNVYAVWGFQVEVGVTATSYIPVTNADVTRAADVSTSASVTRSADILTTQSTATRASDVSSSSAVTRAADSASITGTNFSSWYNSSGGTLLSLREGNSSVLTTSSLTLNSSYTKTNTISNLLYYPTALSYNAIERMNGSMPLVSSNLALNLDAGILSSYSGLGTTWTDLTGNNNNGTLTNGPTYSSSNQGFIRLDGVNDFIDFGNNTTLYNAYDTSFTQEFAVRMLSGASTFRTLFRVDDWSRISTQISILGIAFTIGYSTPSDNLIHNTSLDYNQWYLVTTVWSKLNTQKIYINGILVAQTIPTISNYTGIQGTAGGVNIGRGHSDPFTNNLNADIGFFRHYTRVLTDSEIRQNYNATKYRFAA
jgi:hypothetical protein